ncbi:MAG: integrase, partial [Rhodospirillaceae bacterium]|nr:integrase [Rhodospirillaceae bacterium]
MTRLSKRTVDTLSPGEKEYFVWDEDMPGFGLRVWPTGRKVYLIQYRDSGGRTRRKGLGKHGVVTAEDARKEARELLASVARGANPSGDAKRKRV